MDLRNILVPVVSGGSISACREYLKARRCNRSRPQGCDCSSLSPKLPRDAAQLGTAAAGEQGSCDKSVRSSAAAVVRRDDPAGSAICHQSSAAAALRGSPCNPSASALCARALWQRRRLKPVGQKPLHKRLSVSQAPPPKSAASSARLGSARPSTAESSDHCLLCHLRLTEVIIL